MDFRRTAARGRALLTGNTGSMVLTMIVQTVIRLGGSVIMTRIVPPEAFGTVAIVTSVAVAFALLSDIGIIAFLIRHEGEVTGKLLDEIWTIRFIRHCTLTVLVALSSVPIAWMLAKPELGPAIAIGGLIFVFDALDSLAFVTAIRDQQLKRLNVLEIGMQLAGLAVGIILGLIFRNYWALLGSQFASQLMRAWVSYHYYPGNARNWRWSADRARELWSFSKYITGSTMITLVVTQADKFIFGRLFSLDQFGQYTVASNIAQAPAGLATSYAGRILFPRYSEAHRQQPEQLGELFYQYRRLTLALFSLGCGILVGSTPLITEILYTSTFASVSIYLQILLIGVIFSLSNFSINELMVARGQTWFTLATGVCRLVFLVAGGCALYYWLGQIGIVWALALMEPVVLVFGWITLARIGVLKFLRELEPLLTAVAGVAVGFGLNHLGFAALAGLAEHYGSPG